MSKKSSLERVQNLLILQSQIFNLLDADLSDPKKHREAKDAAKEFTVLLSEINTADLSYLGVQETEDQDIIRGLNETKEGTLQ